MMNTVYLIYDSFKEIEHISSSEELAWAWVEKQKDPELYEIMEVDVDD